MARFEDSWRRALLLLALFVACATEATAAPHAPDAESGAIVSCAVTYGGETRRIVAAPTASPYAVPVEQIGSYFLFRLVVERQTAVKIYVYADRDPEQGGPLPLHQATHAWPPLNVGARGFTGLHHVYEPVRDGELEYWCESL